MRDRVFKTGLGVASHRISAPYLLRNVLRPFFSDVHHLSPLHLFSRLRTPLRHPAAGNRGGLSTSGHFSLIFFYLLPEGSRRRRVRNVRVPIHGYRMVYWSIAFVQHTDPVAFNGFSHCSQCPSLSFSLFFSSEGSVVIWFEKLAFVSASWAMRTSAKRFDEDPANPRCEGTVVTVT